MVRVLEAPVVADVVVGIIRPGDGGAAGGELGAADGAPGREEAAGEGPGDGGELREVGRGRRRGGRGRGGGAVALEVELEEIEEGAGNEGAKDKAAAALDDPLEGDDDAHPCATSAGTGAAASAGVGSR